MSGTDNIAITHANESWATSVDIRAILLAIIIKTDYGRHSFTHICRFHSPGLSTKWPGTKQGPVSSISSLSPISGTATMSLSSPRCPSRGTSTSWGNPTPARLCDGLLGEGTYFRVRSLIYKSVVIGLERVLRIQARHTWSMACMQWVLPSVFAPPTIRILVR